MSELKVHKAYNRWIDEEKPTPNDDLICNEVYLKSEVDSVIDELKTENESLLQQNRELCLALQVMYSKEEYDKQKAENAELKQKLEDAKASAYAESVDAGMRERRLKRELWLARAERAHVTTLYWNVYCYQNNCLYFRDFMPENCNPFRSLPKKTAMEWSDLWESIETKCRAKAKEYK